ncbi:MAG: replicative DNA helicase [Bacteroidetes bacterium]|nr:replicative DNA helicase [Bacteroidota bacterium]
MNEIQNSQQEYTRKRTKKPNAPLSFQEHGKLPPQAIDLEEAVLGAIMLEKDALSAIIDILKPEVFYKEAHQRIYKAILDLFNKSEPIDILTVTSQLKKNGELDIVGGPFYITQLTSRVASSANIEYHTRIISQKYLQRELIRISSDIIRDAFEDTTDVFDLLDTAEKTLFAVSEGNLRRSYERMPDLIQEAIEQIRIASRKEDHLIGIPTGFVELDRVTAGWQRSDLIVIAARPGMGKTAFVLSMARNMAVDYKRPVAFFSLEMNALQLVTRLISSETQLPAEKLKKGTLETYEWEQLTSKITGLTDAPLIIDDTPALSIFELRAKARRLKQQHNIDLIVIDYLQLMTSGGENKGNREQEISNISRSLKSLAKELNIPVIALSQLSREVEKRGGSKRPILSDLRESGAIEQDADLVVFIYRPEYYKIDYFEDQAPTKDAAEIIIAKNRNGALKDIRMKFLGRFAKFDNYETNEFDNSTYHQDDLSPSTFTLPSKMNDMKDDEGAPF